MKVSQEPLDFALTSVPPLGRKLVENFPAKYAFALVEETNDLEGSPELPRGQPASPTVSSESLRVWMVLRNRPKVHRERLRPSKLPSVLRGARQI